VAAPQESSDSVQVEHGAVVMSVGAVDALARLRSVFDNDGLTERIPTELHQAGFTRVFFSHTKQEETDRDHPVPLPSTPTAAAILTVTVFAWRRPVGQLHAAADPAATECNPMLLRLLAEAVGAIFERNDLAERLRAVNTSAREHVREMHLLSETFAQLEG
jgi:hypothetical protein